MLGAGVILFMLVIMNVAAMALITLVLAEKALASTRLAVNGTAAALITCGALVVALPRALPTFAAPGAAASMPASSGTHPPVATMMMPVAPHGGSVARRQ
jgi:hypothetical protein